MKLVLLVNSEGGYEDSVTVDVRYSEECLENT